MSTQLLEKPIEESVFADGRLYCATSNLGLELFAGRPFKRGEIILIFKGNIIGFAEAVAKGDRECWPLQIGYGKYIDLEKPGCLANHSCEPNAGIRDDGSTTHVCLIALQDIFPNDEIRYDYSTTMDEDSFTMQCNCGSKNCRGVVEDFKRLPLDVQNHYLQDGLVMKFIAKI
jgi:hypothetical protein